MEKLLRSEELDKDLVSIGVIVNTHGIKGEAKVSMLTDFPERYYDLKQVFVNNIKLNIISCRLNKKYMLIKFDGINSIDELLPFKGKEIEIPIEDRIELCDDDFYISDIIGCSIYKIDEYLGKVIGTHRTSVTDMLLVENKGKEFYIPFGKKILLNIDIEKKKIIVSEQINEI